MLTAVAAIAFGDESKVSPAPRGGCLSPGRIYARSWSTGIPPDIQTEPSPTDYQIPKSSLKTAKILGLSTADNLKLGRMETPKDSPQGDWSLNKRRAGDDWVRRQSRNRASSSSRFLEDVR
jgi:hypothetical protein